MDNKAYMDDKLISAWTGHPHLRIIDNTSTFEDKMKKLIAEIERRLSQSELEKLRMMIPIKMYR